MVAHSWEIEPVKFSDGKWGVRKRGVKGDFNFFFLPMQQKKLELIKN